MEVSKSLAERFTEHSREVYLWAYRLLGRHHDALDVVQDVFLRWMRQCASQEPQKPRAWLRRVTLHRSIDVRRSRAREHPLDSTEQGSCQTEESGAGQELDHSMLRSDLSAVLSQLSELQRSVLVAKVYDEMTFAQIAEEHGVSVSTTKTHYLRAVRAVRDRLKPRWGNEVSS